MRKGTGTLLAGLLMLSMSTSVYADKSVKTELPQESTDYYMTVDSGGIGVDIYPETSDKSEKLNNKTVEDGTVLHIAGETEKNGEIWGYTEYNGTHGYVPLDELRPSTEDELKASAVGTGTNSTVEENAAGTSATGTDSTSEKNVTGNSETAGNAAAKKDGTKAAESDINSTSNENGVEISAAGTNSASEKDAADASDSDTDPVTKKEEAESSDSDKDSATKENENTAEASTSATDTNSTSEKDAADASASDTNPASEKDATETSSASSDSTTKEKTGEESETTDSKPVNGTAAKSFKEDRAWYGNPFVWIGGVTVLAVIGILGYHLRKH